MSWLTLSLVAHKKFEILETNKYFAKICSMLPLLCSVGGLRKAGTFGCPGGGVEAALRELVRAAAFPVVGGSRGGAHRSYTRVRKHQKGRRKKLNIKKKLFLLKQHMH